VEERVLKMMKKDKKSQFYIFSVMMLLVIVYLLIPKNTEIIMPTDKSAAFFSDYQHEIPYFANNAILNDDESIARDFTLSFLDYAGRNGVDFKATYIFATTTHATIFTTADQVYIEAGSNYTIYSNESVDAGRVKFINLTVDGKKYGFSIGYPSFKVVFIAKKGERKDVFTYG
jgi:hypothetical protein